MTLSPTYPTLKRVHWTRLRQMYRSAGWPCLDTVEIELLAAGLLERVLVTGEPDRLRLTDAGIRALAATIEGNRETRDAHEQLVRRVAEHLLGLDRVAYLGLTLMARPDQQWQYTCPDVFSIRRTSVAEYLDPVIHEIKVRRADLLADLKKPEKRSAYLAASGQCVYVIAEGIAAPDEIPPECGVMVATEADLRVVRQVPREVPFVPGTHTWMTLARACPYRPLREPAPRL